MFKYSNIYYIIGDSIMKHEENVTTVKLFLRERNKDAWCPKEIAHGTGLSVKTVKGILRGLLKRNIISKRLAKIHYLKVSSNRVIRKQPGVTAFHKELVNPVAYYYWNR